MTLLGMNGFDDSSGEPGQSFSTYVAGRAGGLAVQGNNSNHVSFANAYAVGDTTIVGFAYKNISLFANNSGLVSLANNNTTQVCALYYNKTSGTATFIDSTGAVKATFPFQTYMSTWVYITLVVTSAANGAFQVWVEDKKVASGTGNFLPAAGVAIGEFVSGATDGNSVNYIDDLYFANTAGSDFNAPLGDVFIKTISPTGDGTSNQWTNSAGNQANNYTYVNELPSSITTYVEAGSTGLLDEYTNPSVPGLIPLAIQPIVWGAISAAGSAPAVSTYVTDGTHVVTSSVGPFTTNPANYNAAIETTQPDGVTAWTEAALLNCQIGVST